METEEEKPMERQRDEATIKKLRELNSKLCSRNISVARKAAHNLSWMQEDGLLILTQVLTGDFPRTAKKAAAYGLRSMNGRMKKLAVDVLEQGVNNRDRTTKAACVKSLLLLNGITPDPPKPTGQRRSGNSRIQEIRGNRGPRTAGRHPQRTNRGRGQSFNR